MNSLIIFLGRAERGVAMSAVTDGLLLSFGFFAHNIFPRRLGLPFAEPVGLYPEEVVELAPIVLQGDGGRQFDQLFLRELPLKLPEELIAHLAARNRHTLSRLKDQSLPATVERALPPLPHREELLRLFTTFHPTG
jgi:hypothetical protein